MQFITRTLEDTALKASRSFPALVITGPRRSGKTFLLSHLFPKARYLLLEDPDLQARARSDPRGLLAGLRHPVVFDEIQNVPELFPYIRALIDRAPRAMGRWLFTGSQEAPLMQGVTESMAGRAAILQLLPFSLAETDRATLLHGGYPEVLARPADRELWFSSYIQTYLERDVRAVTNVRDLATFRRFLALVASRHGQILNRTGLACYLLGISSQAELDRSPFLGPLFEGFIAAEIHKSQISRGRRKELYYFRDQQALEVDFLFPDAHGALHLVECKASRTVQPSMAVPMQRLKASIKDPTPVIMTVVHRPSKNALSTRALTPEAEALDFETFVSELNGSHKRAHPANRHGRIETGRAATEA